jgi:hypothetical protein
MYREDTNEAREQLAEALEPLGTAEVLAKCVAMFPGYAPFKAYLEELVEQEREDGGGAAGHGWVLVADTQYEHEEHGLAEVRDMPLLVYWATMTRYFGVVGPAEVLRLKTGTKMLGGESVVVFGTRITASGRP